MTDSTFWKKYFCYLDSLDEVLTDAHLRNDEAVLSMDMQCERGGVWTAKLRIANPGLGLFAPGRKIYCAALESPDGTLASARIFFRGRMTPAVSDVTSGTLDVNVICAPADLRNRVWAFLLSSKYVTAPWFSTAYDDVAFDRPEDVLRASGAFLTVDPVTHAIGVSDWLTDTSAPVTLQYIYNSFKMETVGVQPCQRVKIRINCEWTQSAIGAVNIAPVITNSNGYVLRTYNSGVAESMPNRMPGKYLEFANGEGWTLDRTNMSVDWQESAPIYTGRTMRVTQNQKIYSGNSGNTVTVPSDGISVTYPVSGFVDNPLWEIIPEVSTYKCYTYTCSAAWYKYSYTQQRRETITILYDYPLQNIIGTMTERDLGSKSVTDLLTVYMLNPNPPPTPDAFGNYIAPYKVFIPVESFDPSKVYMAGDRVIVGVEMYECQADNTQGNFYTKSGAGLFSQFGHPNWVQVDRTSAIPETWWPRFADTPNGSAVIEHAILCCRRVAREDSEYFSCDFETAWDVGFPVAMGNRATVVAYIKYVNKTYALTGKVTKISRSISKKGKTCRFTMRIPVGSGLADTPAATSQADMTSDFTDWWNSFTSNKYGAWDRMNSSWQGVYPGLDGFVGYYPDESIVGAWAFEDCLWTMAADPLIAPIDASQLNNAYYAVISVQTTNDAGYQFVEMTSYGMSRRDPADAVREHPSRLFVAMRPLSTTGCIERSLYVAASATSAPMGIDLSSPGVTP